MKVYLLNPPTDRPILREGRCQTALDARATPIPQLSLALMATQLRRAGFDVRLHDSIAERTSLNFVVGDMKRWRPRLVIANTSAPSLHDDLQALAAIKEALPEVVTAVFGAHATVAHRSLLSDRAVDIVIRGEPELPGAAVAERLRDGRDLDGVECITHRFRENIVVERVRSDGVDLDRLGWPARDLLPQRTCVHPILRRPFTTVLISRGCPSQCIYCVAPVYHGRVLRKRSVEDVLDEIEHDVVGRHGLDLCWFYADDLTRDKDYIRAICEGLIARHVKIRWWGNTRADCRDPELFRLMARAGCFMLAVGGESGDDAVLARAKKSITCDDTAATLRMLREAGIISLVYFIIGLPGETLQSIRKTVAFAEAVNPDFVEFYPAVPYPGTEFGRLAEASGSVLVPDLEHFDGGGVRFVARVEGISPRRLQWELIRAYGRFYFRFRFLRNSLGRFHSSRQLLALANFGVGYLKRLVWAQEFSRMATLPERLGEA
ncbi:MAG: B12-binding domain-containing radical SAM protein [Elusimicrobiota bacterium]